MGRAIVEPSDRAYFMATVLDIEAGNKRYLVRYLGEADPCWIDASRVRAVPPNMDVQEFQNWDPQPGTMVEVYFADEGQESWWEGQVQKNKGGFYFITFPDEGDVGTHEVVEKERIRPSYAHTPANLVKGVFHVPPGLEKDMLLTSDHLPKLAKLADLFALHLSPNGKSLIGLGFSRAVETAESVINLHFRRVPQLAEINSRASALQKKLATTEDQMSRGYSVGYGFQLPFRVDPDKLKMVIGAKGANIRKAKSLPGIHHIEARPDGVVTVWAEKREEAEAARELLEIVTDSVGFMENEAGFIIGRKGEQVQELEDMSGCRIQVHITGVRGCVAKAKALLIYTIETYREQREKERVIENLSDELRSLGVHFGFARDGPGGRYPRGQGVSRGTRPSGAPMPTRGRGGAVNNGAGNANERMNGPVMPPGPPQMMRGEAGQQQQPRQNQPRMQPAKPLPAEGQQQQSSAQGVATNGSGGKEEGAADGKTAEQESLPPRQSTVQRRQTNQKAPAKSQETEGAAAAVENHQSQQYSQPGTLEESGGTEVNGFGHAGQEDGSQSSLRAKLAEQGKLPENGQDEEQEDVDVDEGGVTSE
ncbi:hypothetical protein GUITHDRAFT_140530 [Guillardia theta CCMP2712]|uniref:K Homology domain-containing protein n=1 Tax=Guillardia theta (strain CCMP2712) TaxID=905079 RepID=L1J4N3_GUITC|nr:hypothetical protein GUITHDRAFT_140530 [Guillardia theta CCMP2712]EKX43493.1 hypothetical protein GUITHDRAFT_140530 [Guillardia theta CCMP2712]|eukprot:XP_005830473.1 hypothetical protein GUITHDRAFT_140530 [Guillardia theta CCMP2712]